MRILLDTCFLIRVRDADSIHHGVCAAALRCFNNTSIQGYVCAQVLIEYWAVATRPKRSNGLGLSIDEAREDLREFQLIFNCLPEVADMGDRWEKLAYEYRVMGRQVHDARIAALMESHQITKLLTLNVADFRRFSHVQILTPQSFLETAQAT